MAKSIDDTCKAIGRYYASVNAKYDNLFSEYLEECGMDEDEVQAELDGDIEDCSIIEFDDSFPFNSDLMDKGDDAKNLFIFELITKCWNKPGKVQFDIKFPQFDADLFTVKAEQIQKIKELYKSQCPVLYNKTLEDDESFLTMLAIGRKCKRYHFDYLFNLVDCLCREKVNKIDDTSSYDWYKDNPHMADINRIKIQNAPNQPSDLIKSSLKAWGSRFCTEMTFTDVQNINNSIENVVRYIAAAIDWVSGIVSKEGSCPFQFDLSIVVGAPIVLENVVTVIDSDCVDDDDDDDGPDYGDKDDSKDAFNYVDCIGDIEGKLKQNKLNYEEFENKTNPQWELNTRMYGDLLEGMRRKLNKSTYPHAKEEYPHRARFVCMVDQRDMARTVDHVYMYQPPSNCRDMENDLISGWFIGSTRTCILPNMAYGDGKEAEEGKQQSNKPAEKAENKDMLKTANIQSSFHCKGALLTLSFIAQEEDAIKSYLYWNGCMMRFMPNDIKTVFPKLFHMAWNGGHKLRKGQPSLNQQFINSKDIDALIKRMNAKLRDKYFEAFCEAFAK